MTTFLLFTAWLFALISVATGSLAAVIIAILLFGLMILSAHYESPREPLVSGDFEQYGTFRHHRE